MIRISKACIMTISGERYLIPNATSLKIQDILFNIKTGDSFLINNLGKLQVTQITMVPDWNEIERFKDAISFFKCVVYCEHLKEELPWKVE